MTLTRSYEEKRDLSAEMTYKRGEGRRGWCSETVLMIR